MREILVDANVLISFLTDRNEDQQKKAGALFQAAADREHILALHTLSIAEMVFVLRTLYKLPQPEIARNLGELLALPGVVPVEQVAWNLVLAQWPNELSSFGDAVFAAAAIQGRLDAVATFDGPLRKRLARRGVASYWPD